MVMESESNRREVAPFAAAIYERDETNERDALARFVAELRAEGVRVGGLLQEAAHDEAGEKAGIDLVDIADGGRFPINRPTKENLIHHTCSLDASVLAESSSALRRAIDARVEIIVLEKFGDQEQKGQGLNDEILEAIAAGIPLLIAVPEDALDKGRERSGDLGDILDFSPAAFRRWWNAVRDLSQAAVRP
jgi:nucleoside-triphosphatase THEP1